MMDIKIVAPPSKWGLGQRAQRATRVACWTWCRRRAVPRSIVGLVSAQPAMRLQFGTHDAHSSICCSPQPYPSFTFQPYRYIDAHSSCIRFRTVCLTVLCGQVEALCPSHGPPSKWGLGPCAQRAKRAAHRDIDQAAPHRHTSPARNRDALLSRLSSEYRSRPCVAAEEGAWPTRESGNTGGASSPSPPPPGASTCSVP